MNEFSKQVVIIEKHLAEVCQKFNMVIIERDIDIYGVDFILTNEVSGVKVQYSPREGGGWGAIVARLQANKFPRHPISIRPETELNRFDIRDVALINRQCAPELLEKVESGFPLSAEDIVRLLVTCCSDILEGDFSLFGDLESVVKAR